MADVSVEFGASDTGLAQTLKNIQTELATLDEKQKTTAMSAEEFQKSLSKIKQLEGLETKIQSMATATTEVGTAASATSPQVDALGNSAIGVAQETQKASFSFKSMAGEMFELKAALENGNLSADEFDKTLRRLNKLEDIKVKMDDFRGATQGAGTAASAASPKVDELGNSASNAGNKAENSAGMFDASFTKIAAAFTVGNLAAKGFEAIIDGVFSAGRAIVDGFGQALDLGGRLSELSARTGETAGSLLVLETAFKNAGLSGDQVGTVINKLQNFMQDAANGGATQKAAMDNLGISLSELAGKTPTEQMGVFAAKIAAIEDPTARAAAASEVFGDKLGGKLLPLLTEFSPSLTDAAGKVGSLASIMDENAGTFDAFGEKIDAVKGKFGAFAAGVLSETIPALNDLGGALDEVDAAAFGQEVGTVVTPALKTLAETVNDTLIPALRGANEYLKQFGIIFNGITGTFSTAVAAIDGATNSFGLLGTALSNAAAQAIPGAAALRDLVNKGNEVAAAQQTAAAAIAATGTAAAGATAPVDAFGVSLGNIKPPAGVAEGILEAEAPLQSMLQYTGDYKANLDGLAPSMASANGELNIGKGILEGTVPLTAELTSGTDTYAGALGGAAEQAAIMAGELNNSKATTEALNTSSAKSVQNQIALNDAIATGNTKEQERLQNLIAGEAQQKRINTLIQEYGKLMPEGQAKTLANEMVRSETAVKGAKTEMGQLEIKTKTVNGLLAQMNQQQIDAPAQTLIQRLEAAQTKLSGMKQFVGVDMQNMPLESIIDKLGLDDYGLTTTESKLKLVEAAVTKLGDADPADLTPTVDEIGVNNELETVKGYLAAVTPPDATPTLDQTDVQNAATDAKDTLETELASVATVVSPTVDDPAKQAVRSDLEATATDVPMTVKADQAQIDSAVGALQAEIKNEFTGGEGGDGGNGGDGGKGGDGGDAVADVTSITSILNGWTDIISTIRDRLPMTALA